MAQPISDPWFNYYQNIQDAKYGRPSNLDQGGFIAISLKNQLEHRLGKVFDTFDHVEIGVIGSKCCVFVARGKQATVLYSRTRGFPSAKLLAALMLLGS